MESTRLFVGNLPQNATNDKLNESFSSYGNVVNVDIKQKKGFDDVLTHFAFVTLEADTYNVNKCIADFANNDWNGNYLNISIAKESFLERLKRERSEHEKLKSKQVNNNNIPKNDHYFDRPITDSPVIITKNIVVNNKKEILDTSFKNVRKTDIYVEKTPIETPKVKRKKEKPESNQKRKNNHEESVENKKTPAKEEKKIRIDENLSVSDKKRIQSMQNMIAAYNEKKSAIKNALLHVDKRINNKIIFDDDYGDQPSKVEKNGVFEMDEIERNGHKGDTKKSTLFDDDSEDSGNELDFSIKKQFEGESGQKLLELQSRFKSDKRFIMDERFLDETQNQDENVDLIDSIEDNEKSRQMEILQNIMGGTIVKKNYATNESTNTKKTAIKTMLRYDPTRTDHSKFINIVEKPEITGKGKKDKKNKKEKQIENETIVSNPKPEVSQERFYKVDDSLKQSMEEKTPFSIFSLFGNSVSEDKDANDDTEYSSKPIEAKSKKNKETLDGKSNPFFYDTSDTEDEKEKDDTKISNGVDNKETILEPKLNMIEENFFFIKDDIRFIEGVEFFTKEINISNQSRTELKSIVKKRINNNLRNDLFHSKKGSHNSFNTVKFKKR